MWTLASYALATLAMLLIVAGLAVARNRRRHVPLMFAALAADLAGLVIVEFVIPSVEGRTDPVRGLMQTHWLSISVLHALLSTLALVGYGAQIVTGRKILAGDRQRALVAHKQWAIFFLATRTGAYVTMWMV